MSTRRTRRQKRAAGRLSPPAAAAAARRPRPLPDGAFFPGSSPGRDEEGQARQPRTRAPNTPIPPRPPVKSPSESRVFKPVVSPAAPEPVGYNPAALRSPHYNETVEQSYFDQCFTEAEPIGEGDFATVFRARSRDDGRIYAVKVSKQKFRGKNDRDKRLMEVNSVHTIGYNRHCVRYHRAWEQDNVLYIQMEFCPCGSLRQFIDKRTEPIGDTQLFELLTDIALALYHIHSHDILHLDIKPENIFMTADGSLKIGDFGISGRAGSAIGTLDDGDPVYMAPELLHERFGKPADIFSAGMTALDLGSPYQLPSGGVEYQQLRQGVIPAPLLDALSADARHLVGWMLAPVPTDRPTAEQLLGHPRVAAIVHARRYQLGVYLRRLGDDACDCATSLMFWVYNTALYWWRHATVPRPPPHLPAEREYRELDSEGSDTDMNQSPLRLRRPLDFSAVGASPEPLSLGNPRPPRPIRRRLDEWEDSPARNLRQRFDDVAMRRTASP